MSLPMATQLQIDAMMKKSQEKFGAQDESIQKPDPVAETIIQQEEPSIQEDISAQSDSVAQETQAATEPKQSFREIRKAKEKAERERDELLKQLESFKNQPIRETPLTQPQIDEDLDLLIGEDDLAEGKHLKAVSKKVKQVLEENKKLASKLKEQEERSYQSTVEIRLKSQFPDIDAVLTEDNIKDLMAMEPEIGATIQANPDVYSKAVSAYKLIKQLGINKEDMYANDRAKALANASKPKPMASLSPQQGESPMSRANAFANGLTDDLKKQLHKEMIEAMKSR